MDDSEVNRLILENLHPKDNIPQPLDEDFYKEIVSSTPSSSSDELFPPTRPNRDNATEASVKKILNASQGLIDKAALKLVAPNAVNVAGAQYHDLVRLSVDEAAIVRARGGNLKYRALRLDTGNFSWGKRGKKVYKTRQTTAAVDPHVTEQFMAGKLLACVSSRPGQVGRCDGYFLEGKELEFYRRKIRAKKQK